MSSSALPIPSHHHHHHHHHSHHQDSSFGSYSATNASFSPASYTRHFLGSPLSWRTGSFGGRLYPGDLSDQLDPTDPMSSSLDSDHGSILNALGLLEGEYCRNYTCCGLNLTDLHALLEHFEQVHVIVIDPTAPQSQQLLQSHLQPYPPHPQYHLLHPHFNQPPPSYTLEHHQGPFDPDDMELDLDTTASISTPSSGPPSPPDTPISTPISPYDSSCTSPPNSNFHLLDPSPVSAFETTVLRVPAAARRSHPHPLAPFPPSRTNSALLTTPDPFNAYAGYSDYSSSMPGTVPSPPANIPKDHALPPPSDPDPPYSGCVPTALLFSSSPTPVNTPTTSRVPSPTTTPTPNQQRASGTLSRPSSSLLLNKPFRCPKPNCNKSYKQANGLKYHMTHGSCNFAPPKDLEQVHALLASKRSAARNRSASPTSPRSPTASATTTTAPEPNLDGLGLGVISETELREVEKEAERRLRPFACGLGDCQRRYKNMNGLRYHYQHSGDHGSHGLALLASGTHECLNAMKAAGIHVGNPSSTHSSPRLSRQGSQQESGSEKSTGPTTVAAAAAATTAPLPVQTQQSYTQQQPYGGFAAQHQQQQQRQQRAQMAYQQQQQQQQQQQYAQHQRVQYHAQAQAMGSIGGGTPTHPVQNMGMYMGMEYSITG